MVKRKRTRRTKRGGGRRSRKRGGRGRNYESSSVRRRRTPAGRGIASLLKGIGKFAAKNAPKILKGARYLAGKSGNNTLKAIANSELLDDGASLISKRFGGRGAMKNSAVRAQAKNAVRKLIKMHGVEGAKKILRSYVRTRGRGVVGKVLGGLLSSILPF